MHLLAYFHNLHTCLAGVKVPSTSKRQRIDVSREAMFTNNQEVKFLPVITGEFQPLCLISSPATAGIQPSSTTCKIDCQNVSIVNQHVQPTHTLNGHEWQLSLI